MKKIAGCAVGSTMMLGTLTAGAQTARFGAQGQVAISQDFQLQITTTSFSVPNGWVSQDSLTTVTLAPALDYFVTDSLSIGGQALFSWSKSGDSRTTTLGLGPRIGYNVPISAPISLWPMAGIMYNNTWLPANSVREPRLSVPIYVPLLVHPAQHFFIGFGPELSLDLLSKISANGYSTDGSKSTTIGVRSTVGGWF